MERAPRAGDRLHLCKTHFVNSDGIPVCPACGTCWPDTRDAADRIRGAERLAAELVDLGIAAESHAGFYPGAVLITEEVPPGKPDWHWTCIAVKASNQELMFSSFATGGDQIVIHSIHQEEAR